MDAISNKINTSDATNVNNVQNQSDGLDKSAFLQLLVTQMQYQDPLDPASNTEYMSQLAQFTSLEEMENLNAAFKQSDAQSLVGSYVLVKQQNSRGEDDYISGLVDMVTMKNGKPYLSINDNYYSYDDLDSVVDIDYVSAIGNAGNAGSSEDNSNTSKES